MDYSYLYGDYQFDEKQLEKYGFQKSENSYTLKVDLNKDDFYFLLTISKHQIIVKVFDKSFEEEYLPFSNKNATGNLVSSIREEVEEKLKQILNPFIVQNNMKEKVLIYVKEKYETLPEYPWEDCNATLKTKKSGKWYGLLMEIPYSRLNKDSHTEKIVPVLNIKCDPERIITLINHKNFFPAYHMNKKYWITILLNHELNETLLYELIDQSYELVEK